MRIRRKIADESDEEVKWVGSHYEENVSKIPALKMRTNILFYR
jgi:hypothetical protein